jgi:hypothetical protein
MLMVIQIGMPEALSLDIKPVLRLKETSKSIKEGSEGGHKEVTEGPQAATKSTSVKVERC